MSARPALNRARDRLVLLTAGLGLDRTRIAIQELAGDLLLDLTTVEARIQDLVAGGTVAAAAGRHLMSAGGKRVRPAVCLLAARAASAGPLTPIARVAATVAEAIHGATLLHDDVIDRGERRRGVDAARVVFGNAASVLGGDLLLVRALSLLEEAAPALLPSALGMIAGMVAAESLQLARRGSAALTLEEYLSVVRGKTAGLFEWAGFAGAHGATTPSAEAAAALATYGRELGVAFQLTDDLLDLTGDAAQLGKTLLADVREGKVTFALIPALRADPSLADALEAAAAAPEDAGLPGLGQRVREAAARSGGLEAARAEIGARTGAAIAALSTLPASAARDALTHLARELAARRT